uniref:hypothetical protein n=1 Tax=Polyozellus multiplex TaxID=281719 RepID=UPI001F1465AC|nr:hypothetical protein MN596_mgp24 [Polyozellus multiplex]UMI33299.1 hypothetical protein [Polyozellus multiplex]
MTDEIKDSTKKNIKEIIYKDHTNIKNEIDNDYVYVIAERLPEVKSIRNELKESIITDGNDNVWTFIDIISNPWVILAIVSAITISGTIIISHYDLTLDQITIYTWTNIKMGFVASVTFIGRICRWILGRKNDPRPPIEPSDGPIDINPNLILDEDSDSKNPILRPFSLRSNVNNSSDNPVVFGPEKPPFFEVFQGNKTLNQNENIINQINSGNASIKELMELPDTKDKFNKINFLINKIKELETKFKDVDADSSTGSITPVASGSKSPVNTDNLNLPQFSLEE